MYRVTYFKHEIFDVLIPKDVQYPTLNITDVPIIEDHLGGEGKKQHLEYILVVALRHPL